MKINLFSDVYYYYYIVTKLNSNQLNCWKNHKLLNHIRLELKRGRRKKFYYKRYRRRIQQLNYKRHYYKGDFILGLTFNLLYIYTITTITHTNLIYIPFKLYKNYKFPYQRLNNLYKLLPLKRWGHLYQFDYLYYKYNSVDFLCNYYNEKNIYKLIKDIYINLYKYNLIINVYMRRRKKYNPYFRYSKPQNYICRPDLGYNDYNKLKFILVNITIQNKYLLPYIIDLILNYNINTNINTNIFKPWLYSTTLRNINTLYNKEKLIIYILSNIPYNYWSIYTYKLKNKLLLEKLIRIHNNDYISLALKRRSLKNNDILNNNLIKRKLLNDNLPIQVKNNYIIKSSNY